MECSSWPENLSILDRKKAVGELIKGRERTKQLRHLVQAQKSLGDYGMMDANVTEILESFDEVLSILNSGREGISGILRSPTSTSEEKESVDSGEKRKVPALRDRRGGYKRRKMANTLMKITEKPIKDSYAWRKYGQKHILHAKYPRNYFRCTHKNDQGCQATKQVQQTEDGPPMYQTTYMGQHTCRDPLKSLQNILGPSTSPTNPNNIFNFTPITSFPPIKIESNQTPNNPTIRYRSSSHDEYRSPNLSAFESSAPTTLLGSSSYGSDHEDVVSSIYSCTTSSQNMDSYLDLMVGGVDFDDRLFDEYFKV